LEKKKSEVSLAPLWIASFAFAFSIISFFILVEHAKGMSAVRETVKISRAEIEDLKSRVARPPEPATLVPPKRIDSIDRVAPKPKSNMAYSVCGRTGARYFCQ
jgi:hypothetical protein